MPTSDQLTRAHRVANALGVLFVETAVPVIALLPDGRFVAANRATFAQYGYSLEELLDLRIHDFIAEARPTLEEDLATAATRGHQRELVRRPHRRKDGSVLWVAPTAGPIDVDGETLIVSVLKEVTPLLEAEARAQALEARAEEDQRRAEALWQAASERLPDGIALIDRELRVLRVNSAMRALVGMDDGLIIGRRCREVFPECARSTACPHEIVLREQRRLVRELGADPPVRIEVLPAPPNEAHFALIHVSHDLHEERAIRSQLITADRLATIGRLAAGVAHEVNNPAAFVTVNLGVLRERFAAGTARAPDVLAMLEESLMGMERIREIVHDLKGFAREKARDRVDLSSLVASAIRMATHETRGRARVERLLEPGVYADVRGARIAQVVLNLLVNAAQAVPAGDPAAHAIVVRTWRDGDRVKIEVKDSGPGIAAEHAGRIFEPFFTTRESSGGTGLGLWLAREIVEEEGGTITFANAPGGGARFVVELTASKIEVPEASPFATGPAAPGS